MLNFMLDTNTAIYVIKERPITVLNKFNQYAARLCVSTITVAELYYGAENSQYIDRNLAQVDDFLSRLSILPYDNNAASHYGNIRADLTKKGLLIGENDMHIAGHARSQGLIVVTNNIRDFERIDGLRVVDWVVK